MTNSDKKIERSFTNLVIRCSLLAILLTAGCAAHVIEPSISEALVSTDPADWSDWAVTLNRCVQADRVDFSTLAADRQALDRFLVHLARSGPRSTPSAFSGHETQLAFAINAHNAAVVAGVLDQGGKGQWPVKLPAAFHQKWAIRVDGRAMSISALKSQVKQLAGDDWRVLLTLYQGCASGPDLEKRVFLPDMLDARLNQTARTQLSSRNVVRIEHGEIKRLLLWDELYDARHLLQKEYEKQTGTWGATVLNGLLIRADADQRGYLNSAIGYDVARMPTDRTIDAVAMEQK